MDTNPTEDKHNDLILLCVRKDNIRENMERQSDHSPGRSEAHDGKKKIPMDDEHLVAGGKVLKDNITLKDYGISGGETTELTVQSFWEV